VSARLRLDLTRGTSQIRDRVAISSTLGAVVTTSHVHDLPVNGRNVMHPLQVVLDAMLRGMRFLMDRTDANDVDVDYLTNTLETRESARA